MIEIHDNFLDIDDFLKIQKVLLGANFPWFMNQYILTDSTKNDSIDEKYNYQFTHTFYRDFSIQSDFMKTIDSVFVKLNPAAIIRAKANLIPRTEEIVEHEFHIDFNDSKSTTAILYINSNDGYTFFESGERIESLENRLVIFDSQIKHAGTTCTDQKVRCVLNLNYFSRS